MPPLRVNAPPASTVPAVTSCADDRPSVPPVDKVPVLLRLLLALSEALPYAPSVLVLVRVPVRRVRLPAVVCSVPLLMSEAACSRVRSPPACSTPALLTAPVWLNVRVPAAIHCAPAAFVSAVPDNAALPLTPIAPSLLSVLPENVASVPLWICPLAWLSKLPDDRLKAWPLTSTPLFSAVPFVCSCRLRCALSVPLLARLAACTTTSAWSDCSVPLLVNAPVRVIASPCCASMPPALVNDAAFNVTFWLP